MAAYSRSNLLALAVLVCLLERPMHPYEMATVMRQRGKEENIKLNYGTLYTVVRGLFKAGLIEARETEREGRRPERTVYELLPAGHRELIDWLSEMISTPAKEYPKFEAALAMLPALPPEDALGLIGDRITRLDLELIQQRAVHQRAERQELPELFLLESDFSIHQCEAELEWVRGLHAKLASGELGGMDGWRAFIREDGERLST